MIKKAVGPITADSEGQGVSVVAIRAQTGIELADNLGIKVPEQNKIGVYGDTYYTVFDLAPAQGTEAAVVADRVELVNVYTVTYRADGKIVATVRVAVSYTHLRLERWASGRREAPSQRERDPPQTGGSSSE